MVRGGVRASRRLFSRFYTALLHAPMRFFESTPRGRILNRVADDVACIDRVLPFTIRSMANCVLSGFASIFVVSFATPWFLLSTVPLALIYYYIQVTCHYVNQTAACKCPPVTHRRFVVSAVNPMRLCGIMMHLYVCKAIGLTACIIYRQRRICFISADTNLHLLLYYIGSVRFKLPCTLLMGVWLHCIASC